jgi:Ca2+-binding EF-hand superfamily protein
MQMLRMADDNRNGAVTPAELARFMQQKFGLSRSQTDLLVAAVDSDLDGVVDLTELSRAFQIWTIPGAVYGGLTLPIQESLTQIISALRRQKLDLDAVIPSWDSNCTGELSRSELKRGLESIGVELDNSHISAFMKALGKQTDGKLEASVLTELLVNWERLGMFGADLEVDERIRAAMDKFVAELSLRASSGQNGTAKDQIKVMFRLLDCDHDHVLSCAELKRGLVQLGLYLTDDEVDLVVSYFQKDKSSDDLVQFSEFMTKLRRWEEDEAVHAHVAVPISSDMDMMSLILDSLSDRMRHMTLHDILAALDRDGNGEVNPRELRIALRHIGIKLRHHEMVVLMQVLDPMGTGLIAFKSLYTLVSQWSQGGEMRRKLLGDQAAAAAAAAAAQKRNRYLALLGDGVSVGVLHQSTRAGLRSLPVGVPVAASRPASRAGLEAASCRPATSMGFARAPFPSQSAPGLAATRCSTPLANSTRPGASRGSERRRA